MKIALQWVKNFSLMLSIPLLTVIYRFLNKPDGSVYYLTTVLDKQVPFLKAFILPYLVFYPFVICVMGYLCYKDRKTYFNTLLATNAGYLLCFLTYALFQTTVPRPVVNGSDLLSSLVSFVYRSDNPYNAFPSLHVLTSFLMIQAANRCKGCSRLERYIIYSFSVLIMISTQLVKQHVIFDLVSAVLLGHIVFELVCYLSDSDVVVYSKEKLFLFAKNVLSVRTKAFKIPGKLVK